MDSSTLGSSVHGSTSQARILECVHITFSRDSSWPRDQTCVSCIGKWILYAWATREACKMSQIIGWELNLGLPCGRQEFYHWTNGRINAVDIFLGLLKHRWLGPTSRERLWSSRPGLGPDNLHFQQLPKSCWCCWLGTRLQEPYFPLHIFWEQFLVMPSGVLSPLK